MKTNTSSFTDLLKVGPGVHWPISSPQREPAGRRARNDP
jgi:hypothetical protein